MIPPRENLSGAAAVARSPLAVVLAALLLPGSLFAQTADTSPPVAPPAPVDQSSAPSSAPAAPVTPAENADTTGGSTVKLSPFEVSADVAKGYFTPSTVAGTRLNNNVGDIPSSVTVIDKQQISDTNSQNINDIMLYEANTQGSHTFTPYTGFTESGGHLDDALAGANDQTGSAGVGGASSLSTRVRGIGAPDNEVDNFFGIYRIPFDTYNVQSVEIDRGPNSLLFGSGSPAGIVNASSADAQLDKLSGDVSLQGGSWGEFRETADLNVPLLRNKVALYFAQEFTSEGFQRQPSSDLTRRQYATITIDPFDTHKTKITASAEFWNNYANDENTLTPYDYVTPWIAAGKPVMNPTTDMVTYLATGRTEGPYVNSTTSPNYVAGEPTGTAQLGTITSSLFAPGIAYSSNHLTEFYAAGQFLYAYQPAQTLAGQTPTVYTPAGQIVRQSQITQSAALPIPGVGTPGAPGGYASWEQPAVSSMAIYNWQDGPNTLASDYTQSRARTYHFDVQQEILPNLHADLSFFRQEFHDLEDDVLNQHSPESLYVDTNATLLNGAPNAYVGVPFVPDYEGDVFQRPEINQNWRGMLEYSLDLRDKVPGWLQWVGHHRFMAEASTHDDVQQSIRFRTVTDGGDGSATSNLYVVNNNPTIPGNFSIGANGPNAYRWQYVGAPGTTSFTQAPLLVGSPGYGSIQNFNATTYNYTTGQWVQSGLHAATVATYLGDTPYAEDVQDQKTYFWQSFFWDDRIVGSLGLNDDVVKNRAAATPPNSVYGNTTNNPGEVEYTGGILNPTYKYDETPWNPATNGAELGGNTYSEGLVIRPFSNWAKIDTAAGNGNLLASFIRTLGFTFNKSDNFNPPTTSYTDLFGNPLPKPEGTEKDYGLEVSTPDKSLYLRVNWFRANNENNPVASTPATRILTIFEETEIKNWATTVVELRNGGDPTNPNFGNLTVNPLTAQEINQVQALTGEPYNIGAVSPTGGYYNPIETNTTTAGGYDVELTYNPLPNWTMKFTGGRQDAKDSAVDPQANVYLAARLPYYKTVAAPDYPNVITNYLGNGPASTIYVGSFWNGYGFDGNVPVTGGPNGGPTPESLYYQNVIGIPLSVEEAAQGTAVPEASEYSFNYFTNYTFTTGPLRNFGVGGALRWISSSIEGYYGDPNNLNSAGQIAAENPNAPIYTPAELHADAWVSYSFKLPWDDGKVRAKVQFNVQDLTSNGYLQPIQYNLDGSPATYRIIPPRQFTLTTTFSF